MTYSIVAADPETGAMGVAVQSHWFSVGSLVTWAEPGVGAVATQANVDASYGPRVLAELRGGLAAPEALAGLIARDELRDVRQVAAVDAAGGAAAHTGASCMTHAGHVVGDRHACQGNIMATPAVWTAMSGAYAGAEGDLVDRLLAALDAGEAAGGDVRGRQSAALVVVAREGEAWERTFDLRVEDHPEPLAELRRLTGLRRAYGEAGEGDRLTAEGDFGAAAARYLAAHRLAPESVELEFWAGLFMAMDDPEAGTEHVRAAVRRHPGWADLLARLGPDDAPAARDVLARLRERRERAPRAR
jgi:uncharacterized Ntn-hydrolase superfamily protein